jgi:hypothetical protein
MRLDGHALTVSGLAPKDRTGLCRCGWEAIGSSKAEVTEKYQRHLLDTDTQDRNTLMFARHEALADWLHNCPAVIRAPAGSYAAKALAEIERRLRADADLLTDLMTNPAKPS